MCETHVLFGGVHLLRWGYEDTVPPSWLRSHASASLRKLGMLCGAKIPSGQDLKAPPTSCAGGLRGGSSSTRGAFRGRQRGLTAWLCPHKRLWELRIYATAGFLTLRNWVRWWICFKLLNFEVICYAAVDKICWQTCRWIGVRWWVNILLKICKNICNTKIYKIWNI